MTGLHSVCERCQRTNTLKHSERVHWSKKQNNYLTSCETEIKRLFLPTKLEEGDVALDSRTRPGAGCYLHAVADPRGQTGNQHG